MLTTLMLINNWESCGGNHDSSGISKLGRTKQQSLLCTYAAGYGCVKDKAVATRWPSACGTQAISSPGSRGLSLWGFPG